MLEIHQFICLDDNFAVLIHNSETGQTMACDAPDGPAIALALDAKGWTLDAILITHKHPDHVQGIPHLKDKYDCVVIAPEASGLALTDVTVSDGDQCEAAGLTFKVIETPGHTLDHVVFYCADHSLLLAADTLFSLGCGRMFEGTAAGFWDSLDRLRQLPDDTTVYCGHEYTLGNARFALTVDPDNQALTARVDEVEALRADGKMTLPVKLGDEKKTNPFLRADDPGIRAHLDMTVASNAEVFAEIRRRKDVF